MRSTATKAKQNQRDKLASDVQAFLDGGGEIYQATSADNVGGHDTTKKGRGERLASINHKRYQAIAQQGEHRGPHQWRNKSAVK